MRSGSCSDPLAFLQAGWHTDGGGDAVLVSGVLPVENVGTCPVLLAKLVRTACNLSGWPGAVCYGRLSPCRGRQASSIRAGRSSITTVPT